MGFSVGSDEIATPLPSTFSLVLYLMVLEAAKAGVAEHGWFTTNNETELEKKYPIAVVIEKVPLRGVVIRPGDCHPPVIFSSPATGVLVI